MRPGVKLHTRLALLVAMAVALAVVGVAAVAYFATRNRLLHEVDRSLGGRANRAVGFVPGRPPGSGIAVQPLPRPDRFGDPDIHFELIDTNGNVIDRSDLLLPVDAEDRELAVNSIREQTHVRSVTVDGTHVRVRTTALDGGGAFMVARNLSETDRTLRDLEIVLGIVCVIGIGGAALVGWATARRALRPIDDLTDAAEHVALTHDFTRPVDGADRDDEIGRLAKSFNAMLEALEQ